MNLSLEMGNLFTLDTSVEFDKDVRVVGLSEHKHDSMLLTRFTVVDP